MPLSRRSFLRSGTLTAFAAATALGPGLTAFGRVSGPAVAPRAGSAPAGLTLSAFEPYVGGVFRGQGGRGRVNLTLLRVEGYAPDAGTKIARGRARATDSFTLTFGADRPLTSPSGTHALEHGALGRFDLFLTGGSDARGRHVYQAVINHLV